MYFLVQDDHIDSPIDRERKTSIKTHINCAKLH